MWLALKHAQDMDVQAVCHNHTSLPQNIDTALDLLFGALGISRLHPRSEDRGKGCKFAACRGRPFVKARKFIATLDPVANWSKCCGLRGSWTPRQDFLVGA